MLLLAGSACLWLLRELWIAGRIADADYLLTGYFGQLAVALLFTPLCAARLRDIGWSPYVSLIVLVPALTDTKLFVWLALRSGDTVPMPAALVYAAPLIVGMYLVLLLFLFFRRAAPADLAVGAESGS